MLSPAVEVTLSALELAQAGRFADVRELFTVQLQPLVVPEALETAWNAELAKQGPITSVGTPQNEPTPTGVTVVKVPVTCEGGGFTLVAAVSEAGQLAGLQLAPLAASEPVAPWAPPDYADPAGFEEHEVTLGSPPLEVAGTVSLPHQITAGPAVVLLAGSGSLDRDETIGANKPLKDIAWGLASLGVAVLRFDKVTYTHAREIRHAAQFTLSDEYLPHAVAAVELLQEHAAVDGSRVFLLGHSLGGTVAPRIAAAHPSIAGLILLAGGAQPLHWVLVRQVRYLASLNPESDAASRPAIEALSEKARLVDSPDLTAETPPDQLPLGAPASYWLDLRDYDPAELAATLGRPMLILQGGRDYQVTVDDDLARWKAALDGRAGVTFRVYPALNHLFAPGRGPSSPAEYQPAQHVDAAVVADIASWCNRPLPSAL
jgi:uncharacterized protein